MNRFRSSSTESFVSRRLQPLLHALSGTQRAALTGVVALCALLVCGAALAPARIVASSVENRLKLTHCFHLKLTHPICA